MTAMAFHKFHTLAIIRKVVAFVPGTRNRRYLVLLTYITKQVIFGAIKSEIMLNVLKST